ncbi:hypothetical protein I5G20_29855 [Pseudomonas aeruginosa]|nr:hypothetical protein [Pseudomonas aeruginosa]MBG7027404.1 hypothetical protein [Pseudomonas aeruginosa]MBG7369999.1 hypothetical protein [Pseudomonas aeruginosa]
MGDLMLIDRPEKDWQFEVMDTCVLNSGSPLLLVEQVFGNGDRGVTWIDEDGVQQHARFPSICLRPHFLLRVIGG